MGMVPFIYRCPATGLKVQGLSDKPSQSALETVNCLACGKLHVVQPKLGRDEGSSADSPTS
jgi:hypothetical protein